MKLKKKNQFMII